MTRLIRRFWFLFSYRMVYKSKRIGNYRIITNRFTGEKIIRQVHWSARLGVTLSDEQKKLILELLNDETN